MAKSRLSSPAGSTGPTCLAASRTPGPLGWNPRTAVSLAALLDNTPGPLGRQDRDTRRITANRTSPWRLPAGSVDVLSLQQLQAIVRSQFPKAKSSDMERYLPSLNRYLPTYDMTTAARIGAFLGQVSVETGGFASTSEGLYYKTPGRLHSVWPKLFPTLAAETDYLRSPQKLANHVYANKGGNGGPETGDGWNYRGSGLIQLTFKNAYAKIGAELGLDLVGNPDLVRHDPEVAVRTALQYWSDNKLNKFADDRDYRTLTSIINKARLHYDIRVAITEQAIAVLSTR